MYRKMVKKSDKAIEKIFYKYRRESLRIIKENKKFSAILNEYIGVKLLMYSLKVHLEESRFIVLQNMKIKRKSK